MMKKVIRMMLCFGAAVLCTLALTACLGSFGSTQTPSCTHNYVVSEDVASTCAEAGYTKSVCSLCADVRVVSNAPLAHTSVVIPGYAPTCTSAGLTDGSRCSVCGKTISTQRKIDANGHIADVLIAGQEATCTENGLTDKLQCLVCKIVYQEQTVIPARHIDEDSDKICDRCYSISDIDFIEIRSVNDLKNITSNLSGNYRLSCDLNLSGESWTPIGVGSTFTGIFDGNGHKITGLQLRSTGNAGLFYNNGGSIVNLCLSNITCTVEGSANIGGFAAVNSGSLLGCTLSGTNSFITHQGMRISESIYDDEDDVYGWSHNVGGICAENKGDIKNCTVSGSYSLSVSSSCQYSVSGFAAASMGLRATVTVTESFGCLTGKNSGTVASSTVSATGTTSLYAESTGDKGIATAKVNMTLGALIGVNNGTVDSCSGTKLTAVTSVSKNPKNGGEAHATVSCTEDAAYKGLFGVRGGSVTNTTFR